LFGSCPACFNDLGLGGRGEGGGDTLVSLVPLAGFFENKEADARAHGIAPERKLTKEEAYADFMTAIAADVREVEAREQDEAVDAAKERADREAFEQRCGSC